MFVIFYRPPVFNKRDILSEMACLYEFLTKGIDAEDIEYMKRSYEALLSDDTQSYWLNDTHWVDHPYILFLLFSYCCNVIIDNIVVF